MRRELRRLDAHLRYTSICSFADGALPQTFEDPDHADDWTGLLGDGDPLDVCDISTAKIVTVCGRHRRLVASHACRRLFLSPPLPLQSGQAYSVKVLGALAMIDGGETDWKILAVRTDDPLTSQVNGERLG